MSDPAKQTESPTAEERLAFLKSKGITVHLTKTSDRPEPYLCYVIEEGSEFDDTAQVLKMIDVEKERDEIVEHIKRELLQLGFDFVKYDVSYITALNALFIRFGMMRNELDSLRTRVKNKL